MKVTDLKQGSVVEIRLNLSMEKMNQPVQVEIERCTEKYLWFKNNSLQRGDSFPTKEDTLIVYIANNHQWFHIPKKLYDIFLTLKGKDVIIVGGSDQECYLDIEISGKVLGVNVKRNNSYIYSADNCPIK